MCLWLEPRSAWGRGGRGVGCGLHFLWQENPALPQLACLWGASGISRHRFNVCVCFFLLLSAINPWLFVNVILNFGRLEYSQILKIFLLSVLLWFCQVSGILLLVWNALWKNIGWPVERERNYLPSQKLQDQVVIMSRWLLGEPIFEWIKECKPWLTAGLHANSTLSSHSALAASTRSTESWLTLALFHVGLVLFVHSLCPEQQGPGGGYLSAACLNKKRLICWIICNFLPFCVCLLNLLSLSKWH